MARKFLPFIVESSTPIHIYQTILSRSKGMNKLTVASIFNLILGEGIVKTREHIKKFPEMSLEKTYETLINTFPKYRVDSDHLILFNELTYLLTNNEIEQWDKDLSLFELKDVMPFLVVMGYHNKLGLVTSLDFSSLLTDAAQFVLNTLTAHIKFSNTGIPTYFKNGIELRAFILYQVFICKNPITQPIKAVLGVEKSDDTAS